MKKVLISDVDLEQRLRSFLRGYTRVPHAEVCRIALTQMPHVWIYTSKGWQKITRSHAEIPKHMSWCQWALTSTLGLDRRGYERAKKDLFGGGGVNGVYFRQPDEYALVYKPSRVAAGGREEAGLTAGQWAAVGGGSLGLLALGGLGVNQLRNRKKGESNPFASAEDETPIEKKILKQGPDINGYTIKDGDKWEELCEMYRKFEKQITESYDNTDLGDLVNEPDEYRKKARTFFNNEKILSNSDQASQNFEHTEWPVFNKQVQHLRIVRDINVGQSGISENRLRALLGPETTFSDMIVADLNEQYVNQYLEDVDNVEDAMKRKFMVFRQFKRSIRYLKMRSDLTEVKTFCKNRNTYDPTYFKQAYQELLDMYKGTLFYNQLLQCAEQPDDIKDDKWNIKDQNAYNWLEAQYSAFEAIRPIYANTIVPELDQLKKSVEEYKTAYLKFIADELGLQHTGVNEKKVTAFTAKFQHQAELLSALIELKKPESEVQQMFGLNTSIDHDITESQLWKAHRPALGLYLKYLLLLDPTKIDLWYKYEVAQLFESTLRTMRDMGSDDDNKRSEVNKFSRERCTSEGIKRVFFDQAYELLVLKIEQQHLDINNAVPFAPCSDEDGLIQELKANTRKLNKWKLVYERALGQDKVPAMPTAADIKQYDPIPEYNVVKSAYDTITYSLAALPDWETDQKYAQLRSLVQETGKSILHIENLQSRIEWLKHFKKKQSDALAGFRTVSAQRFQDIDKDETEWLREIASTFDHNEGPPPFFNKAKDNLELLRRYTYLLGLIRGNQIMTFQEENPLILNELLSRNDVPESYRGLIRDALQKD
jgi:hypothetical protein